MGAYVLCDLAFALTVLSGDVNSLLGNTTLIRIIDSPTPTTAVSIAGVLGVDNISAANVVPEPSTLLPVFVPSLGSFRDGGHSRLTPAIGRRISLTAKHQA